MTNFDFKPNSEHPLVTRARATAPGVVNQLTSLPRRAHKWARPAWADLPSLLRTLRDGVIVLTALAVASGVAAAAAAIAGAINSLGGSPFGY